MIFSLNGLGQTYCTTNDCVVDLLEAQQDKLPDMMWTLINGQPRYVSSSYIPPSPTGCTAYVAVLPSGNAVTVSNCGGTGTNANIFPDSLEELLTPGNVVQDTMQPGGKILGAGPKVTPKPSVTPSTSKTSIISDIQKTLDSTFGVSSNDIPQWAIWVGIGLAGLVVLKMVK